MLEKRSELLICFHIYLRHARRKGRDAVRSKTQWRCRKASRVCSPSEDLRVRVKIARLKYSDVL